MSDTWRYLCPTRGPMNVSLPMELRCPFCSGVAGSPVVSAMLHPRTDFVYKGKTYLTFSYKCDNCKQEFTTTDSDEVSVGDLIRNNIKRKQLIVETVKSVLKIKTQNNG